ncbi:hypothetical protein ACA910_016298 [Epithemia clementina (nom. ined.)]
MASSPAPGSPATTGTTTSLKEAIAAAEELCEQDRQAAGLPPLATATNQQDYDTKVAPSLDQPIRLVDNDPGAFKGMYKLLQEIGQGALPKFTKRRTVPPANGTP